MCVIFPCSSELLLVIVAVSTAAETRTSVPRRHSTLKRGCWIYSRPIFFLSLERSGNKSLIVLLFWKFLQMRRCKCLHSFVIIPSSSIRLLFFPFASITLLVISFLLYEISFFLSPPPPSLSLSFSLSLSSFFVRSFYFVSFIL